MTIFNKPTVNVMFAQRKLVKYTIIIVKGIFRRLLDNSRIRQLAVCQLADWTTRGLDNSRTGQVADWTTRGCHRRLCVLSFPVWRYLRDRELSSPRLVQSVS